MSSDARLRFFLLCTLPFLVSLPAEAQAFSVTGPGGNIPASGTGNGHFYWPDVMSDFPFVSDVEVPNAVLRITGVDIDGLNHTWIGDVQIVLFDPTGRAHNLMSRPGFSGKGFGSPANITGGLYTFVESGGELVPDWGDMPAGTYNQHFGMGWRWPSGTNHIFNTGLGSIHGSAGTWSLKIYDWAPPDVGSCTGWTLHGSFGALPASYCTAKINSLGCLPRIGYYGLPSAGATSGFTITAGDMRNNKPGFLMHTIQGRAAIPWQNGTLCLDGHVRRTPVMPSHGSLPPWIDCSGGYRFDMNAFASGALAGNPIPELRVPGMIVDCQWWARDASGLFATSLTDALEYVVGV